MNCFNDVLSLNLGSFSYTHIRDNAVKIQTSIGLIKQTSRWLTSEADTEITDGKHMTGWNADGGCNHTLRRMKTQSADGPNWLR